MSLSDPVVRALRHADQMIREAERGDAFGVYDACRAAVAAISRLDDFYIALVQERDRQISYPYMFSNGRFLETGTVTYGPRGVVAWVVASRKPYCYRDDDGALLNHGVRFGDGDLSADAVVVPMVDDRGVIGLMGALSDSPEAFTDEVVTAMGWLAGLVVDRVLAASPSRRLDLGLVYPELLDTGRAGTLMAVNHAASALTEMASQIEELRGELERSGVDGSAAERLTALGRRCFEVQAALVTRLGAHATEEAATAPPPNPLDGLSPRERAVVELVVSPAGDPGNAGIAKALGIGTPTVKSHMASALAKLGLRNRSELRWLVKGSGPDA
ncbi:regulatory LuxR family protein [Humibacillus xanthopallidus]|uniref:Regulatory LuxR family protein n=1 Tax=Humibacillus xanthopallidus TaxID=412689 RepID=A0A543PUQ9_9MICO|nr:LuxR C-terminal-related transcriptional regulator [Humibacillus xanthopallidus]TQN47814.1 regulatory LuxR family protein [Humibacillus xanthopallidus]